MAKQTLQDANIVVTSSGTAYTLSSWANQVTMESKADEIDFTTFTASGYKQFGQGMKDATVTITFFQDYAGSAVHQVLQPVYDGGGTILLAVRPTSSAKGPTNPEASMTCRLFSYSGIDGKVGDALTTVSAFRNAGTAGLTWATA